MNESESLQRGREGDRLDIHLTDEVDYPALRDYFLRLGASVERTHEGIVEVRFSEGVLQDDESAEMYLRTWVRNNRVAGQAALTGSPPGPPTESVDQATDSYQGDTGSEGKPRLRLGELLLTKALINESQLAHALVESRETGEALGRVLVRHGAVYESELARVLAEQWAIPYVNLALVGVDRAALSLLPREVGLRYAAVPVRFVDNEVRVAFADPSDPEAVAAVQERLASPVQPAIAEYSDIDAVWRAVAA